MKEVTEYIVKEIVDNKDAVKVEIVEDATAFVVKVQVAETDIGRVIGKQGKTANAIRTIVRALTSKDVKKKVLVKFN